MISEEREKEQSNSSEYVTYQEAAEMLDVAYGSVARAVITGTFTAIRPMKAHHKVIPRWEVEAVIGWTISSKQAREILDELRRQKANEYAVDGTADHESEYELRKIIQRQEVTLKEMSDRLQQFIDMDLPTMISVAADLAANKSVSEALARASGIKS